MKKTFKFMAMALAAVVMAGGAVSCDPMDKDNDQQEQTGGNTDTPSDDNNGSTDTPATLSIDGKQWVTNLEGTGFYLDFGVTEANIANMGYCDLEAYLSMMAFPLGAYTITVIDATSGTIDLEGFDPMTGDPVIQSYPYIELTENSVKIDSGIMMFMPSVGENIVYNDYTLAPQTIVPGEE